MLTVVQENNESNHDEPNGAGISLLDEIVRDGARQMLTAALLAEVAAFIEAHSGEVDENGHRLVVRNGSHQARYARPHHVPVGWWVCHRVRRLDRGSPTTRRANRRVIHIFGSRG